MPTINHYVNIDTVEREARKDYIDRHSPFIHCATEAKKGEKFTVTVKVGNEYKHPDDFDHYISWVQLFDGETFLAQATTVAGALGNMPGQLEVSFNIVPTKAKMKLVAHAYCTKHGIWESDPKEISVAE